MEYRPILTMLNDKEEVTSSISLRIAIRKMPHRSPLYKLLKSELSALGHWKNKPRGKPGFHPKLANQAMNTPELLKDNCLSTNINFFKMEGE